MVSKGVSTWSLHRTLESFTVPGPGDDPSAAHERSADGLSLLDLPAELAARGYATVQICHFQIPNRDPSYLERLRGALDDANIELDALLIDAGDLTHPTDADEHQRWIEGWVDDAVALGATNARVVAGKQLPTLETLSESARRLEAIAESRGSIRILTENWGDLLSVPSAVECAFDASGPDERDYKHCLQILRDAGYEQTTTLIYDGPDDDEWAGLETEWNIVQNVFAPR